MKTGWAALVAAMLLPLPAAADNIDKLVGREITVEVVALDGNTLLVLGPARPPDLPEILGPPIGPTLFESGETRIRLWGISAPEISGSGGWAARAMLDALLSLGEVERAGSFEAVATMAVTCRTTSVHGRGTNTDLVARCGNREERDLGEAMLREGFAIANRTVTWADPANAETLAFARLYDLRERLARQERRGLWSLRP
ncbi:MAG: thermonuclease family protein [Kiloniellaceae bacterium]